MYTIEHYFPLCALLTMFILNVQISYPFALTHEITVKTMLVNNTSMQCRHYITVRTHKHTCKHAHAHTHTQTNIRVSTHTHTHTQTNV